MALAIAEQDFGSYDRDVCMHACCVWFLRYAKTRIRQGERSKLNRVAMVYALLFFFFLEAYIMGVAIQNFLVPLQLPSLMLCVVQYGIALTYFVSVIFFTRTEMKRLILG